MKQIRGKNFPKEFVDWMFGTYGLEELMPDDKTIFLWSIVFEAGKAVGYQLAREDCW